MHARLTFQKPPATRVLIAAAAIALMVLAAVWLAAGRPGFVENGRIPSSAAPAGIEAQWGIRVIGIRRTAADYMLDFRYRLLNAEKAAALMNRKVKPYLIVEHTGRRLQVPVSYKLGPLRQSPKYAKVDRNYFMFFANPGREVKAGDKVTVVIGDFKAEHLTVQ
jgi:hypothetical protein